jgi:hypothetical protein
VLSRQSLFPAKKEAIVSGQQECEARIDPTSVIRGMVTLWRKLTAHARTLAAVLASNQVEIESVWSNSWEEEEMEEAYQDVTITPIRRLEAEPFLYRILVNGMEPYRWTMPGIYRTPEKVIASFTTPLRLEYQSRILDTLRNGNEIKFLLRDAVAQE